MKKAFVFLLSLSLFLLMILPAGAETCFVTDGDGFASVGDVSVTWLPEGTAIVFDGDTAEWAFCPVTEILPDNMVSYVGGSDESPDPLMPRDFAIRARFAADGDGLYLALEVTDDHPLPGTGGFPCDGDTVRLGLDFGCLLRHLGEANPDLMTRIMPVFYSICLTAQEAPFTVVRQESERDGVLAEDAADEAFRGIRGACALTGSGWCAEVFLSWERLISDAAYRIDPAMPHTVTWDAQNPLVSGLTVCYVNMDPDTGLPEWEAAAVTDVRRPDDESKPLMGLNVDRCGARLTLDWQEGRTLTGIDVQVGGTQPETSPAEPETAAPLPETVTQAATEYNTAPADDTAPDSSAEAAAQTASEALPGTALAAWEDADDLSIGCESCLSCLSVCALAISAALIARRKRGL